MPTIAMPRRPKPKREEIKVNYRLAPIVKQALAESAERVGRSENLQAEHLLKVGLLASKGLEVGKMSEGEIIDKFIELFGKEN